MALLIFPHLLQLPMVIQARNLLRGQPLFQRSVLELTLGSRRYEYLPSSTFR